MPRKKALSLDDIDPTLLPFQSRTTLGQYLLAKMEERQERAKNIRNEFPCQLTLTIPEVSRDDRPVI